MVHAGVRPQTPEERLIWWAIVGTWALWLAGALYHALPLLAWVLAALGGWRWLTRDRGAMPAGAVVWIGASLVLLAALVAGHVDFELGPVVLAKSLLGWGKGWALFAVLPVAGAFLVLRPAVVVRATTVLGAQTLAIGLVFCIAAVVGLPATLYVSPLAWAGGGDWSFFEIGPYQHDPGWLGFRLRFFAPWAPAAALVGAAMAVLSAYDRDRRWAWTGMLAGFAMCLLAQSRLGLVALATVVVLVPALSRLRDPALWGIAAAAFLIAALAWEIVAAAGEDAADVFTQARADSSRVRAALQSIALHRWWTEAPWFGHGIVERGPHLVEFMPIGSHHTWFSLLFVKGAVGLAAFGAALCWTLVEMLMRAQRRRTARMALGVALVLLLFSFGENLEILAYLAWPALLVLGIAMRRSRRPAPIPGA